MGTLRFILAIIVVIAHTQPLFGYCGFGGLMAVQTFFIISGFYMSMILNEKYCGKNSYKLFISNRILKIFPIYWIILILSIAAKVIASGTIISSTSADMSFSSIIYLILVNTVILGQDTIMFLQLDGNGMLSFCSDFRNSSPRLHSFLIIPQAWSLSVELMFYFIAPFIVRKKFSFIFCLVIISMAFRLVLYCIGLTNDPWTYRFFPTELALFLMGSISYKIYIHLCKTNKGIYKYFDIIAIFAIALTLLYPYINACLTFLPIKTAITEELVKWMYYIFMIFAIPALFKKTKNSKLDRNIAELSYPIYISHILIVSVVNYGIKKIDTIFPLSQSLMTIVVTMAVSIILIRYIINPIERIRQNRIT